MIKVSLQFAFGVEIFLQSLQHFFGRRGGRDALYWFSILVDNKFREIPLDSIKKRSTLFLLQILVQWMGAFTVDVNLLEQIEFNFVVSCKTLNLFSISRLLVTKLIAWESENTQTCEKMRKFYQNNVINLQSLHSSYATCLFKDFNQFKLHQNKTKTCSYSYLVINLFKSRDSILFYLLKMSLIIVVYR